MRNDHNPPLPTLPHSRSRLAVVLRATKDVVSVDTVVAALDIDRQRAGKLLSRWCAQGWLRRIGHGLYVSVPIELADCEQVVEDPWVLIPMLFGQCYIGGWSAAHHWELTDQLFNETLVFTTRRLPERHVAQGVVFVLRHTTETRLFGLTKIWRGSTRVTISDAARTMIDMIAMPGTGGGIDHVTECLAAYVHNNKEARGLLIQYAEQFGNGVVFKRLGYLAEKHLRDNALADECRARLTQGYARLDPSLSCKKLVTAWRLWVPAYDR